MAASETNREVATAIGSGVSPLSGSNMLDMLLGLLIVLAVIIACAWLYKRMAGMQGSVGGVIRVIAGLSLGSRDRVALIEVGEQKILLGISPGRINTLHVFTEDPLSSSQSAAENSTTAAQTTAIDQQQEKNFAGKLQSLLNKQGSNNE